MDDLSLIIDKLDSACCPEDVFGTDLTSGFRTLAKVCHPDVSAHPLAEQAFQMLTAMKEEADARVKAGTWGKKILLARCVPLEIGGIQVKRSPHVGDISDVYRARFKELLVKVARSFEDNDLMRAEREALKTLDRVPEPVRDGIPKLSTSFQVDGIKKRVVNVIERFPGFWTAQEIHSVTKVDERTATWMFKRILSVLSWTHHFELIHGAVLPSHVMFYPDNDGGTVDKRKHTVRLVDWCYSLNFKTRTRLSAWVPAWKDLYAPELLEKTYLGPESDLYMAAQLVLYLTQGPLPKPLQTVMNKCLRRDPAKRYRKAGEVLDAWSEAATEAFGTPKWHDFNLPTTPSGR